MFCNEYADVPSRSLVKYEKYSGEIQIRLWYSIDYEEEKECYDFEGNKVKLMYDWISLKFVSPRKEFFEMELA